MGDQVDLTVLLCIVPYMGKVRMFRFNGLLGNDVKGTSQEKLVHVVAIWDVVEGLGDVNGPLLAGLTPGAVVGHDELSLVRAFERGRGQDGLDCWWNGEWLFDLTKCKFWVIMGEW